MEEIICSPCNAGRLSIPAEWYCLSCYEYFCQNCKKIHKAQKWSQWHMYRPVEEKLTPSLACAVIKGVNAFKSNISPSSTYSASLRKLEFMKELESRHDHLLIDVDGEFFCPKHEVVICDECRKIVHFYCNGLMTMTEAAAWLKSSTAAVDVIRALKNIFKHATAAHECFRDAHMVSQSSYEQYLQKSVDKSMYSCPNECTDSGSDPQQEHLKHLEHFKKQTNMCAKIQNVSKKDGEELSAIFSMSNSAFVVKLYVRVKNKCSVYEKMLKEICDSAYDVEYKFVQAEDEPHIHKTKILNHPRCLPKLLFQKQPSRRNLNSQTSNSPSKRENNGKESTRNPLNKSFSRLTLEPLLSGNCGISGLDLTHDGNLIVADRKQSVVYFFNKQQTVLQTFKCSSLPWDVSYCSAGTIFASIPGENIIAVLKTYSIEGQENGKNNKVQYKISKVSDILCPGDCYGIAFCKNKLFTTFNAWKKNPFVGYFLIHDVTFESKSPPKLESIPADSLPLVAPQHIATNEEGSFLCVSDSGSQSVIALEPNGQILYIFQSRDLIIPTGVTVGLSNSIYVACRGSNCVHKINSSGFDDGDPLLQNEGIIKPRAICYDWSTNKILIADNSSGILYLCSC